jgi:hypothetical protein
MLGSLGNDASHLFLARFELLGGGRRDAFPCGLSQRCWL